MRIAILTLFFLIMGIVVNGQSFIDEPYFFFGSEEASVYFQSNDTLRIYSGFIPLEYPKKHRDGRQNYKILAIQSLEDDFIALKMKDLDEVVNSKQENNQNPYVIIIFEKTQNQIKPLMRKSGLSENEMENYNLNKLNYQEAFGFPFYSLEYMKELYQLKSIKTKNDYDKIINTLVNNSGKYKDIGEDYQNNFHFTDMYGSGFTGFLLTKTCIDLGYNPFYAGLIGQVFEDDNISEERIKERLKLVYEDLGLEE